MDGRQHLPTSSKEMSNDQALWLFENGATLVILDMPTGSEFGIDFNSWEIGENFKGIKMIPPGFHYVYYSAVGMGHQVAPRTGFMHFFKPKEVLVKTWNKMNEDLSEPSETSELVTNLETNKRDLDRFLGVYPYESLKKWIALTNYITPESVERVMPLNGQIYSAALFESQSSTTQSRLEEAKTPVDVSQSEDPRLPDMTPVPGSELRFVQIGKRNFSSNTTPSGITALGMDNSCRVRDLFGPLTSSALIDLVLTELQLAFVCFLPGQVYEAFEHWKKMIVLLCGCVSALEENPQLFIMFIGVLHYHIKEIPEDFFFDIVTRDNFLSSSLTDFFENIKVSNCSITLKNKGDLFRRNLERKFSWDFDYETGENAPVVVEMN